MTLSGREKATIFLSILGAEASSRILRYLPDEIADLIAAGINHLPVPSPDALSEVFSEFNSYLALPNSRAGVARLEEASVREAPKKNYAILMYERPQMQAFLLKLMTADQKNDALYALPKEKNLVAELLANLRSNSLSDKLGQELKQVFAERLF